MADLMTDFNIRRGLSSVLFSEPGIVNPDLILEEGCWYLCTDTAELFLCTQTDAGLTLKHINDAESHPVVNEVKDKVENVLLPTIEKVENEIAPTVDDIKNATDELKTWVENKEYLQDIDLEGYATEEYVDKKFDSIEIPEVDLSNHYTIAETDEAISTATQTKADSILFKTDKFVTNTIGNFKVGDDIKGFTIAELFAKLLGLSDVAGPDIPDEPNGVIETIIAKQLPMYAITTAAELAEIPFSLSAMTEAEATAPCSKSGFYQIRDVDGNIIESGYQEIQIDSGDLYYIIALPKEINYDSMITIMAYDDEENIWGPAEKFEMTTDPTAVQELCDEVGVDISHIDQTAYTIYVWEDLPSGSLLRYIINE